MSGWNRGWGWVRWVIAREEALEVEHNEAVLGVLLRGGSDGGGGGGGRGGGGGQVVGDVGGGAVAGEGLFAGAGALVEDGAVDLRGREEVAVPAAAAAGVDGVGRRGSERHEIRLRKRPEVHDGCHLRPHCPRRRHRRRLWADGGDLGVWLRREEMQEIGRAHV